MKSHELAKKLLSLPDVDIRISTHMGHETFELADTLNIHESEFIKSIVPDKLFSEYEEFDGCRYIELFAVKD